MKKTNRRNLRVIAKSLHVCAVMENKHPWFFSAAASGGKIMPSHFIKDGTKSNTSESVKNLKEVLMPWIKKHYNHERVTFVQGSVPYHGSKTIQDLLLRELPLFVPKDFWSYSSPDLNPCDYRLWCVVEKVSNNDVHTSIGSLKRAIKRVFRSINREQAVNTCKSFRRRIQQVIDARGSHIEF